MVPSDCNPTIESIDPGLEKLRLEDAGAAHRRGKRKREPTEGSSEVQICKFTM